MKAALSPKMLSSCSVFSLVSFPFIAKTLLCPICEILLLLADETLELRDCKTSNTVQSLTSIVSCPDVQLDLLISLWSSSFLKQSQTFNCLLCYILQCYPTTSYLNKWHVQHWFCILEPISRTKVFSFQISILLLIPWPASQFYFINRVRILTFIYCKSVSAQ